MKIKRKPFKNEKLNLSYSINLTSRFLSPFVWRVIWDRWGFIWMTGEPSVSICYEEVLLQCPLVERDRRWEIDFIIVIIVVIVFVVTFVAVVTVIIVVFVAVVVDVKLSSQPNHSYWIVLLSLPPSYLLILLSYSYAINHNSFLWIQFQKLFHGIIIPAIMISMSDKF